MAEEAIIGTLFTWTPQSPEESGKSTEEWKDFIDNYLGTNSDRAHIQGKVIYNDGEKLVIEVTDMSQALFHFTLFQNEIKNRYPSMENLVAPPYQRFLCIDVASLTSLYYYDMDGGYLAEAIYDEDGNFEDYDIDDNIEGIRPEHPICDGFDSELISIELSDDDIHDFEEKEAITEIEDAILSDKFDDEEVCVISHPSGINRACHWSNTCDCAILTAWRGGKTRKTNDDNNRELQHSLRDLGYGVTKVTGWFPEKDKKVARENSFLVVNLNEEESFRNDIFALSEKYDQDCFLYKEAGYDVPAVFVYTNDSYNKGTEEVAGRLRIGNMAAKVYSQIKTGRITFE